MQRAVGLVVIAAALVAGAFGLEPDSQALPNGNVLVTESTRGRVFEVTRDGTIVWTFLNPDFEDGRRQQIYRMRRVSLESYAAWVASASGSTP